MQFFPDVEFLAIHQRLQELNILFLPQIELTGVVLFNLLKFTCIFKPVIH